MPFTSETAKLYRGPGGRKRKDPKEVRETKKMVAELAREYIEKHVDPVLQNWGKLAEGWMQKRFTDSGYEYEEFCYDSATTRHFVDKILPDDNPLANGQTLNIFIAQATKPASSGSPPEVRGDSIQIRIGGNDGKNGNGSDSA